MYGYKPPVTDASKPNKQLYQKLSTTPEKQKCGLSACFPNLRVHFQRNMWDSDGYEEIGSGSLKPKSSRPTAMQLIQSCEGQHHTLWCEIPEVVSSGILSKNMQLNICAEG